MLQALLSDQTARVTGRAYLDLVGRTWSALQATEWLLTNGIGGFASGTVSGANTRRYHGLLVAAFNPPGDRRLVFAKIDERLRTAVGTHELATNEWQDRSVSPQGYRLLMAFSPTPHPTWTYADGGVKLTKEIILLPGQNTVQVRYSLDPRSLPAELDLIWLVNHRDPHGETDGKAETLYQQRVTERGVLVQAFAGAHPLAIAWERGAYKRTDVWHYRFYHAREAERGQWATEDHYNPGITTVALAPGDQVTITATTEGPPVAMAWQGDRRGVLDTDTGVSPEVSLLQAAVPAYLVARRQPASTSLIAGYPWFGEWGRDAMIALPGLTLVTGRYAQARELLATFIHFMDQGIIPNTFPDNGAAPEYNTIDATMWLFHALDRYWAYTHDDAFLELVYPRLVGAIDWYNRGTHHGIGMDQDGLIGGASHGRALTWMDAVVGDWVVTPREGKPVEVNGLWIHALRVMSVLARRFNEADPYAAMAATAAASFRGRFWEPGWDNLADRLEVGGYADRTRRPNQAIALAMPNPWLPAEVRRRLLTTMDQQLWTPYGLRSLAPSEAGYRGVYDGNRVQRDGAYHQGTVWPWLTGPYVTAWMLATEDPDAERARWRMRLQPLLDHVGLEGCLGHVAELFDGDPPHLPKGCLAQAWSLSELLRAWVEEVEGRKPPGLTEV